MARLRPDFQEVMKKDLMKKFIEQVAYKKMEEWYEHKLFVFKGTFFFVTEAVLVNTLQLAIYNSVQVNIKTVFA